ncbi:hypothetical protein [Alicyclobacillus sp. ALC3]|uniref:hypothetical protein n=1 Tax=Alicyclobacillus sp. ALC3 TaxID=2796143 RepID=UPI0023797FB9|nr:hypothetical protein [Alicyclobacillus sp. ALC3]WDL99766.1 hypothetical protein JC200_23625 [Alicyclobacillus sp. ALC3]
MKRIALTDGSNTWFDADRAERFDEDTNWNGNNWISVATGSQWEHEVVYRTASGKYVLHTWSNWEGTLDTYSAIDEQQAFDWLLANDHADAIPKEEDEARSLDAGETPRRTVRIPDDLWQKAQEGGNASKLIIDLLTAHFAGKFL